MAKHIVGAVSEIPPGTRKIVEIAGRSIGVFNVAGEFFALRNSCPHQGGPLCKGRVTGFLQSSAPGQYTYTRRGEFLRCPWHGWEFDIKTGQSWFDPARTRVRSYPVSVEEGLEVSDSLSSTEPVTPPDNNPASTEPQPGPYVAETYAVSVDRSYVVVEVP